MHDPLEPLFSSVDKQPSYWKQVALLEFLQSLELVKAAKNIRTNKEFAKLLGVSEPTLSRWLNGIENITVGTMCRLAAALGAAVHIHVADNKKKGRWKEEPGEANPGQATPGRYHHISTETLSPYDLDTNMYIPAQRGSTAVVLRGLSQDVAN